MNSITMSIVFRLLIIRRAIIGGPLSNSGRQCESPSNSWKRFVAVKAEFADNINRYKNLTYSEDISLTNRCSLAVQFETTIMCRVVPSRVAIVPPRDHSVVKKIGKLHCTDFQHSFYSGSNLGHSVVYHISLACHSSNAPFFNSFTSVQSWSSSPSMMVTLL
jgi:hypothetical protein